MRPLRAFILLLALTIAASATAELRVYDVDLKYRQEVYTALRGVLRPGAEFPTGQIQLLPTGQILIDTSPEMHSQVAAILDAINDFQVEPTPRVTLRYWAVLGTRDPAGNSEDAEALPAILSDVLDELRRVHGDLSFRLLGNATLVTESGQEGSLDGDPLTISQTAWVQGATLNAELIIRFEYGVLVGQFRGQNGQPGNSQASPFSTISRDFQGVSLNTSIEQDEFVVVGENTIRQNTVEQGELNGTIFYIVHWPVEQ